MNTAMTTLLLSYSSYCGDSVTSDWNCYWCKSVPSFNFTSTFGQSNSGIFGFVGYMNDAVYVAFRGTDNVAGWIADAKFQQTPYFNTGAKVHKGFFDLYNSVSDDVRSLVMDAINQCGSCNNVIVAGHSLGAALSVLGALDLQSNTSFQITLYNFGDPRVGDYNFYNYAKTNLPSSFRFTNHRDLVPHLPPITMNYHHIVTEIWFNGNTFITCDQTGEDPNCANSVLVFNIKDHATYLGINIVSGIPYGCMYTDP